MEQNRLLTEKIESFSLILHFKKGTKFIQGSFHVISFIILTTFVVKVSAQSVDPSYQVGTWRGFKSAAISYTFDDNCPNQMAKAVPIFNALNFQATFFTVITWSPNWKALKNAMLKGHEIGSHTMTHPNFGKISDSAQAAQMKNSFDSINFHIPGLHGMTIAYPYCVKGNDSITSRYYFAARGCQGYIEKSTPADFLNISSILCGKLGSVKTTADFDHKAEAADSSGGWCVYLMHGIDNDGGYSPVSSAVLKESLEYLDSNRGRFWVGTFGNVVRYIRERNSVSLSELAKTKTKIKLRVTDTLADSIYDYPVTFRRPLPQGWNYASGSQNGKKIAISIVQVGSKNYIQFDAVPNRGQVTLKKSAAPVSDLQNNSVKKRNNNRHLLADHQT